VDLNIIGGIVVRNLFIGWAVHWMYAYWKNASRGETPTLRTRCQHYFVAAVICGFAALFGAFTFGSGRPSGNPEDSPELLVSGFTFVHWATVFFLTLLVPAIIGVESGFRAEQRSGAA